MLNITQSFHFQARVKEMRSELDKLRKGNSTHAERRFAEMLKRGHIPFKTKVIISGREVDFLIGKYAIDIDGHDQVPDKNVQLVNAGYIPIHFSNQEILFYDKEILTNKIKNLC